MTASKQSILDQLSAFVIFIIALLIFSPLIGVFFDLPLDLTPLEWIPIPLVILIILQIFAKIAKNTHRKEQTAKPVTPVSGVSAMQQGFNQGAQSRSRQEIFSGGPMKTMEAVDLEKQRQEQEEARMKKLQQIIKVSTKLAVERIAQVLDLPLNETWKRVFDWAEKFQFTIDGDFVIFNKDTVGAFIEAMDKEFASWHQQGKV